MVTVGLVRELTAEAARQAALGAGAKLVGTFAYRLTAADIAQIDALAPDILLLCGGTDGGNARRDPAQRGRTGALVLPLPCRRRRQSRRRPRTIVALLSALASRRSRLRTCCRRSTRWTSSPPAPRSATCSCDRIVKAKGIDRASERVDARADADARGRNRRRAAAGRRRRRARRTRLARRRRSGWCDDRRALDRRRRAVDAGRHPLRIAGAVCEANGGGRPRHAPQRGGHRRRPWGWRCSPREPGSASPTPSVALAAHRSRRRAPAADAMPKRGSTKRSCGRPSTSRSHATPGRSKRCTRRKVRCRCSAARISATSGWLIGTGGAIVHARDPAAVLRVACADAREPRELAAARTAARARRRLSAVRCGFACAGRIRWRRSTCARGHLRMVE